jgi:hypothetical protein
MALRAMPTIGGSVLIRYLASSSWGTVREIGEDGRRLLVSTEEGETVAFVLNGATATFTAEGSQEGARLSFGED